MSRFKSGFAVVAVLGVLGLCASAVSAVVIRVDNGNVWTVGKGDVQSLFGWDAKTTDAQFASVGFTYEKTTTANVLCEYEVTWDVSYEETVGGEKNQKVMQRSKTMRTSGSIEDVDKRSMIKDLQYEVKKNANQVVVGATIWPGGSHTEVTTDSACDVGSIPLKSIAELQSEADEGHTVTSDETIRGAVKATVISSETTETIWATTESAGKTSRKGASASGGSMTMALWSESSKFTSSEAGGE